MGTHQRAWSGLNIVIFGSTPTVPMKLELALAKATPSNETKIYSFEDYNECFEFCKAKGNVGLIVLLENCGGLEPGNVFHQLSSKYQETGWPCFGLLLHESTPSISSFRTLKRYPNILEYCGIDEILERERTTKTLNSFWTQYIAAFECQLLPQKLQETLLALAYQADSRENLAFMSRLSVLLGANLNLSWIEKTALQWVHVVNIIQSTAAAVTRPNSTLIEICEYAKPDATPDPIWEIARSKSALSVRLSTIVLKLKNAQADGSLESVLSEVALRAKPGAPALIRHIAAARHSILSIADQVYIAPTTRKTA